MGVMLTTGQMTWTETFIGLKLTAMSAAGDNAPGESSGGEPDDAPAPGGPPISAPGGPAPNGKSTGNPAEPDLSDDAIDKIIGDPQKKLIELAKRKIPVWSEEYKSDTPRSRFLDDMGTGVKKVNEYLDYMSKVAEFAKKHGKALAGIADAAGKLKSITDKLKGVLGKVGGAIEKAQQVSQWIDAVSDFADVSARMDPKDRKSVEHWVSSMQNVWNKTAPFVDWLKDKGTVAAIAEGSEAGAALSVTLSFVAAELYVGIKVLDVGVKNVNAYLDRYDQIMRQIDEESGAVPPEPAPVPPAPWQSREEKAAAAQQREDDELRGSMRSERRAHEAANEQAHQAAVAHATEEFETKLFVGIYKANRPHLRHAILAAVRKAGGTTQTAGASPESKWWDCLMSDDAALNAAPDTGGQGLTDGPFFDQQAGIYVYPTKARVNNDEAAFEIANFRDVRPPCPLFVALHDGELKKHLAKAVPR